MTPKEVEKIVKKDGWYLVSIEGSHHHYKHHEKSGKVTIPFHKKPKDLSTKTLKSIFSEVFSCLNIISGSITLRNFKLISQMIPLIKDSIGISGSISSEENRA